MIPPDDDPDVRWWDGVSAALAGAADGAGRLAHAVADDWRDVHGQEWAERVALMHRELGRAAAEAAAIGAAITRRATEPPSPPITGPVLPTSELPVSRQEVLGPLRAAVLGAAAAARDQGPRLGAVAGDRTDSELGMRLAELSDPTGPDPTGPDPAGPD